MSSGNYCLGCLISAEEELALEFGHDAFVFPFSPCLEEASCVLCGDFVVFISSSPLILSYEERKSIAPALIRNIHFYSYLPVMCAMNVKICFYQ